MSSPLLRRFSAAISFSRISLKVTFGYGFARRMILDPLGMPFLLIGKFYVFDFALVEFTPCHPAVLTKVHVFAIGTVDMAMVRIHLHRQSVNRTKQRHHIRLSDLGLQRSKGIDMWQKDLAFESF